MEISDTYERRRKNFVFGLSYFIAASKKRFYNLDEQYIDEMVSAALDEMFPLMRKDRLQRLVTAKLKQASQQMEKK